MRYILVVSQIIFCQINLLYFCLCESNEKNIIMLSKIISGGQTGVDRAALDSAIHLGISHGGRCPKDRIAEDGKIAGIYDLKETSSTIYQQRTRMNVKDSDATLIVIQSKTWGTGTSFTKHICKQMNKRFFVIDVDEVINTKRIWSWLKKQNPHVLNVAGNRESTSPGIYMKSYDLFLVLFAPDNEFMMNL